MKREDAHKIVDILLGTINEIKKVDPNKKWIVTDLIGLTKRVDSSRETINKINVELKSKNKTEDVGRTKYREVQIVKPKKKDLSPPVVVSKKEVVEIKKEIINVQDVLKYTDEEIIEILGKDIKKLAKGMGCTSTSRNINKYIDEWRIQILEELNSFDKELKSFDEELEF